MLIALIFVNGNYKTYPTAMHTQKIAIRNTQSVKITIEKCV